MGSPFANETVVRAAEPASGGRRPYVGEIAEAWCLRPVPQGGLVTALALRAMAAELGDPAQRLRTLHTTFAAQVTQGPVEIDVELLRRGRSMSHLRAEVRNPGADRGHLTTGVFGATRDGFAFTDLRPPAGVPKPGECRSFRDPLPPEAVAQEAAPTGAAGAQRPGAEGAKSGDAASFDLSAAGAAEKATVTDSRALSALDSEPMPFWGERVDGRHALGHAVWDDYVPDRAERAMWYRFDEPPFLEDGTLDPLALVVLADTMPGAVGEKVGRTERFWFGPSVDLTVHLLDACRSPWVLAHNRARHAGDGYASADMALWDCGPDGADTPRLVAYATQAFFFTFFD